MPISNRPSIFDRATVQLDERMSLLIDEVDPSPTPLDILLQVEEYLLESHGMTFMQAVRAGIKRLDDH